ncbi:MAG: ATP synthase F1 subunit delta [Candidatus Binatia bacterium]
MRGGVVAIRYAKALFQLASEEGTLDDTGRALAELAEAVARMDAATLAPGVMKSGDRQSLAGAIAVALGESTTIGRFLRLLALRDRLAEIPNIDLRFRSLEDGAAGRVRIGVTAAHDLSGEELAVICARFRDLAGCEVVPELTVDAALIGGVEVEMQGRVYDGSLKTQLARLASRMAGQS